MEVQNLKSNKISVIQFTLIFAISVKLSGTKPNSLVTNRMVGILNCFAKSNSANKKNSRM